MRKETQLTLLTICGSVREDSYNAALVRALPTIATGEIIFREGANVADVPIYDMDLERLSGLPSVISQLVADIREADGVVIVSPEYNYSIPGGLKNMLDWVSRAPDQPFAGKPVLIQSVSAGALGGARMQHHLRQVMVFLDAHVLPRPEVMIGPAGQRFDEGLLLVDKAARDAVRTQLDTFVDFVRLHQDHEERRTR